MSLATVAADLTALVLDTNAVLDGLVFADPGMSAVMAALEAGTVRWLACMAMRDELARTLRSDKLTAWSPNAARVLEIFDAKVWLLPPPGTLPALRCSDPDDQVFIDLAAAAGAGWLLTHDRALLRLARRARGLGVRIVKPADWRAE